MAKNSSTDILSDSIYQFKIHLVDFSPQIWRRFQVRSSTNIAELHYVIQLIMGWSDTHLNCFKIYGRDYGVYHDGGLSFTDDPMEVRLMDLRLRKNQKFIYEYDFTEDWGHEIRLENILPADPSMAHPVCLDGKRACPPEDIGGSRYYPTFLTNLSHLQLELFRYFGQIVYAQDPENMGRFSESVENDSRSAWENRYFNPERFDKKETDGFLEELYQKKGATLMDLDGAFQDILLDTQWY